MTLFDKNKQQSSNPDLSNIKQASNPNSVNNNNTSQLPSFNSNPNTTNNSRQDEFVNPFNSNNGNNMGNNQNGFYDSNNNNNPGNMNSYQPPSYDQQTPTFNSSSNPQDSMNMGQTGTYVQSSLSNLNSGDFISKEQAEEIIVQTVESVLEDKWEDITKNVRKVVEWKDKVESQITLVKEDIVSLQDAFSTLEKRLISKLNNYDKSILDVGSEIKALDKVFQKVTPTLVNNVTELGRIAKELKSVSNANKKFDE
ncbi:MAG: hypothetical protein LAT82_05665 [Nanoarchaeota archaeon]|nr:hypothetical protein [Nanoarchaeota archaeon]